MKSKLTAGLLALLLGDFGLHKFYLDETKSGVIYLLFSWTLIPALIALIDGIVLLTMSDEEFNAKYNAKPQQAAQSNQNYSSNPARDSNNVDLLLKYKKLLDENVITQEEFDSIKRDLMNKKN